MKRQTITILISISVLAFIGIFLSFGLAKIEDVKYGIDNEVYAFSLEKGKIRSMAIVLDDLNDANKFNTLTKNTRNNNEAVKALEGYFESKGGRLLTRKFAAYSLFGFMLFNPFLSNDYS